MEATYSKSNNFAPSFGTTNPPASTESTGLLSGKASPSSELAYDGTKVDAASSVYSLSHQTNVVETFLHLVKGYMGAGCLSLPWAVSQLGVLGGVLGICSMSLWTSYNCWTVVSIKRYMMNQQQPPNLNGSATGLDTDAASSANGSNITYPEVGEWAYGGRFQSYVTSCICIQQLAICTVFVSFIGENLLAVFLKFNVPVTHVDVMTMALPFITLLSFSPSLKTLAPVMAAGTVLLGATLAALGYIVFMEWPDRPDVTPDIEPAKIPLALCAILYSYEGICLILPVESAMEQPEKFAKIFWLAMALVAAMLASVAVLCVVAFGDVTSGSVTAFLLETYEDNTVSTWIMIANTAVSLSVLLTYPLQLFPALELLGPAVQDNKYLSKIYGKPNEDESDSLSGFDPLPPLPEDDVASLDSLPNEHHNYEMNDSAVPKSASNEENDGIDGDVLSFSGLSDVTSMLNLPVLTMAGDSVQLRATLVLATYLVAVVVPNVQALISLAGALAGSSTALLIPPVLELAWMEHLEQSEDHDGVPASPHTMRLRATPTNTQTTTSRWSGKFWKDKIKCYILFGLGLVFMAIGTYASILDITEIYMGTAE